MRIIDEARKERGKGDDVGHGRTSEKETMARLVLPITLHVLTRPTTRSL